MEPTFAEAEPTAPESSRLPPLRIVAALLRDWRLVVGLPTSLFVLVVAFVLGSPKTYTSSLSFTPVGVGSSLGQLAAMAAQAGFALPAGGTAESPQFYADLVRTEHVLRRLASTTYTVGSGEDRRTGTLIQLYEIEEATPERTLYEGVRRLREKILTARPNRVTGVTVISVKTKWPELSLQLAREIQRVVDDYNVVTRSGQARSERQFLEARVDTARAALRELESRMQSFLLTNRVYRDDPRLVFEHDRLERELNVRQDTYLALTRALEQARIDEVRNTPSITLVEPPTQPLRFDRRGTLLKGLLALFLGSLLALGIVAAKQLFAKPTDNAKDEAALEREIAERFAALPGLGWLRARRRA